MFGRNKREEEEANLAAQRLAEEQRLEEQNRLEEQRLEDERRARLLQMQAEREARAVDTRVFLESEIIPDDEPILEELSDGPEELEPEELEEEIPELEPIEDEQLQELTDMLQLDEDELEELDEEPSEDAAESNDEQLDKDASEPNESDDGQPEIVYQVEQVDDDEIVKPAKLIKLPSLVDYMLSMHLSKQVRMNFATMIMGQYNKYKNNPEEKAILVACMKKIMSDLMYS